MLLLQILTVGQKVLFAVEGVKLRMEATMLQVTGTSSSSGSSGSSGAACSQSARRTLERSDSISQQTVQRAFVRGKTAFIISNSKQHPIQITGQKVYASTRLFTGGQLTFEQLGVGGLDQQLGDIFRRTFASRTYPIEIVQQLGIKHVKGLLLYGPPGQCCVALAWCRSRASYHVRAFIQHFTFSSTCGIHCHQH
jgi:hypothetical protein